MWSFVDFDGHIICWVVKVSTAQQAVLISVCKALSISFDNYIISSHATYHLVIKTAS